jgi:hypothetical protein
MQFQSNPLCPFCESPGECRHLIGWTEDGRTVELRLGIVAGKKTELLPTDQIIKTGVSARVYRKAWQTAVTPQAPRG